MAFALNYRILLGFLMILAIAIDKNKAQDNFYFHPAPAGQNVIEGSNTRIRCDVSNRKSIQFYWTFNNRVVSNTSRRYQDGSDLVILNANRNDDSGSFRCVATNTTTGVSKRSTEAILTIIWIDKEIKVQLKSPASSAEVNEGIDLSLLCEVDGNPIPQIKWFRNDIRLSDNSRLRISGKQLDLAGITAEDNGIFSCTAENSGGQLKSTSDYMLNIAGRNAARLEESTFTKKQLVQKSGRAQFNCVYRGASITEWYFNERRLANSSNSRILVYPNGTLVISQVRSRDQGTYKCVGISSNSGPAQTFSSELVLAYLGDFNANSFDPKQDPSKLNIISANQRFEVKCTIPKGLPAPTQRWEDPSGRVIGTTGRVTAVNGVLTVTAAQRSDSGGYACVASNKAGEKKQNVSLIVTVPPTIRRGPRPDIPVEEGDIAVLQCNVDATPYPVTVISWIKEGTPIDKNHPRFYPNSQLGTLRISDIHIADEGNYACRVNTTGHPVVTSGYGRLEVIKKLKFLPKPVDTKLELGSKAKIHCRAEGQTKATVSWHKRNGFAPHVHQRDGTLEFDEVVATDKGYYTCKASSPTQGHINATIYVDVVVKPKFKVKPLNTTAYEGYPVMMHCQAIGDPRPTIQWDRNGQINAFDSKRFQKQENGSLAISEVYMGDMGRYGCTAGNSGGFERTEVFLTVKGAENFVKDRDKSESSEDEGFDMMKTILIAVCSAVAYLGIVIGLTVYCSIRLVAAKNRRKALEAEQQYDADKGENGNISRSPEQQPMIDKKDRDSCVKSDDTRSHVSGVSSHPSHSSQSHNSRRRSYDKFSFPRHDLQTIGMLGKGYFGDVFLAKAHGIRDGESETLVVVKSLLSRDENLYQEFRHEMDMFSKLSHENVAKLLGICRDVEPHFMILEYCDWGDLKQFLWATRKDNGRQVNLPPLTTAQKISMCNQVALGLEHLANNRFIHKDIAARNVLLSSSMDVKVSLLGLSRDVYAAEYFHFHQRMIPLRWMAPEAVLEDEYSNKSDVWSYGVFVWEMFTLGELPHRSRSNEEVLKGLKAGDMRPEPITSFPEDILHLMTRCWQDSPKDRPSFTDIVSIFNEMTVDSDV